MISGGFAGGGESSSARRAHLRSIRSAEIGEIQAVSKLSRLDTSITFSDSDMEVCQHPHGDPLVVCAIVANKTVHRVLVDNGSSADIIFASAFDKMGIGEKNWSPSTHICEGFLGKRYYLWAQFNWCSPWESPLARQRQQQDFLSWTPHQLIICC